MKPKALVLTGYGINCEEETNFALNLAGAESKIIHINDLIADKNILKETKILVFPGGFSYGDDTGSGKGFANKVRNNLFTEIKEFVNQGNIIIGICNGFQVLVNSGLLPATNMDYGKREVALLHNEKGRFECRWVKIKNESNKCVFTKGIKEISIPIAHGEGNFYAPPEILEKLKENDQVVFRYINNDDTPANGTFPENPNGSMDDIAGICDETGRILGMMPHPERAVYYASHPDFFEQKNKENLPDIYTPALKVFENAVKYFTDQEVNIVGKINNIIADINKKKNIKGGEKGRSVFMNQLFESLKTQLTSGQEKNPEDQKEKSYKQKIKENLNNVLISGYIPELGEHKKGKVRDVHFTGTNDGDPIIMVASDRVSAYDHVIPETIPYKGKVLNLFAKWAFENTQDIVPNALVENPNDHMVIQKQYKVMPFEFVVRGYVWGSMAKSYEKGEREFCGIQLKDGLLRYQKLPEPILTPATKFGATDENVSFQTVVDEIGLSFAEKLKEISFKLFNRASELARKRGLVFIDTKYEFGTDKNGEIYLIDEANTPDSSRYCTVEEYKKFEKIQEEMSGRKYKDVSELLEKKSELKIEELSKQFVRDVLEESNFSYGASGEVPHLNEEQVIETSYRYISLYENVTGRNFDFGDGSGVKESLISNLVRSGYIKGGITVMMAGSDSDVEHLTMIKEELDKYGIPSVIRICSAHKQGSECTKIIEEYNKSIEPILIIAVAGGTDALSGLASFHSVWPVVSCPPKKEEYESCLANPPGSANALILRPGNVAKFAAQYFGFTNTALHGKIEDDNQKKIKSLTEADEKAKKGELTG